MQHYILVNIPRHQRPPWYSFIISNLSFTYPCVGNEPGLKNINLTIPQNKVTALVGMSGIGKTTLVKMLLKFHENYKGEIKPITMSPKSISKIGGISQEIFIFNDTIRLIIKVVDDTATEKYLFNACITANIFPFLSSFQLGFNTTLGEQSNSIYGRKNQWIAIARAVYKNLEFIFLDEANNSLDASNETIILQNLQHFINLKPQW